LKELNWIELGEAGSAIINGEEKNLGTTEPEVRSATNKKQLCNSQSESFWIDRSW